VLGFVHEQHHAPRVTGRGRETVFFLSEASCWYVLFPYLCHVPFTSASFLLCRQLAPEESQAAFLHGAGERGLSVGAVR